MMPKNNPKDRYKNHTGHTGSENTQHQTEEDIADKLPSDSSAQTDEDILTYQKPEEERTVESERPDGDMRK